MKPLPQDDQALLLLRFCHKSLKKRRELDQVTGGATTYPEEKILCEKLGEFLDRPAVAERMVELDEIVAEIEKTSRKFSERSLLDQQGRTAPG